MSNSYDKWLSEQIKLYDEAGYREVWDHQQRKIDELEKENTKLREALESIANDDANEYDMVCKHYTDLKREAREVLNVL